MGHTEGPPVVVKAFGASKMQRMEQAVRTLLEGIGEDVGREGLVDTPKRVAKAILDMTEGYRQPLHRVLGDAFFNEPALANAPGGLVLVRDIDFAALSQDTLLPFHGRVHIAYMPAAGVVLGLSKLARLTRAASKQLQSPQGMALAVIDVLQQQLRPQGVAVVVEARHLSFTCQQPTQGVQLVTSGCFNTPQLQLLPELLAMLDLDEQQIQFHVAAPNSSDTTTITTTTTSSSSSAMYIQHNRRGADAPCPAPALRQALTRHCLRTRHSASSSLLGRESPPPAPITPDPSEDSDSEPRSEAGSSAAEACEQLSTSDFENDSMEAAMAELLGEAGVEVGRPGVQAAIRRYVLSLLAATSGYHQELLVGPNSSSSSSSSSRDGGMGQQATAVTAASGWGSKGGGPLGGCPCCSVDRRGRAAELEQLRLDGDGSSSSSSSSSSLYACPAFRSSGLCTDMQQQQQQQQGVGAMEQHHLPFISQCEHHMLPFYGTVHVALLQPPQQQQQQQQVSHPQDNNSTVSSSSSSDGPGAAASDVAAAAAQRELRAVQVAHIVSAYTQRLQVQERITQQVAEAAQRLLGAGDVMVVVRAAHMCMVARGVENHAGTTVTRVVTGKFASDAGLRASFLRAVSKHRGSGQQQQQ